MAVCVCRFWTFGWVSGQKGLLQAAVGSSCSVLLGWSHKDSYTVAGLRGLCLQEATKLTQRKSQSAEWRKKLPASPDKAGKRCCGLFSLGQKILYGVWFNNFSSHRHRCTKHLTCLVLHSFMVKLSKNTKCIITSFHAISLSQHHLWSKSKFSHQYFFFLILAINQMTCVKWNMTGVVCCDEPTENQLIVWLLQESTFQF